MIHQPGTNGMQKKSDRAVPTHSLLSAAAVAASPVAAVSASPVAAVTASPVAAVLTVLSSIATVLHHP